MFFLFDGIGISWHLSSADSDSVVSSKEFPVGYDPSGYTLGRKGGKRGCLNEFVSEPLRSGRCPGKQNVVDEHRDSLTFFFR